MVDKKCTNEYTTIFEENGIYSTFSKTTAQDDGMSGRGNSFWYGQLGASYELNSSCCKHFIRPSNINQFIKGGF